MVDWIRVDDRMPEEGDVVLAWSQVYGVIVASWAAHPNGIFWDLLGNEDGPTWNDPMVTHWSDRPSPPSGATLIRNGVPVDPDSEGA